MTDDEAEANLFEALANAIAVSDPPMPGSVLVTSYVVVAAFTDADGRAALFVGGPETQRNHESLGLLEFARLKVTHDVREDLES